MRHGFFWILLVVALPQVAAAERAIGAGAAPMPVGEAQANEQAEPPAITAAPGLDLRIDPAQLLAPQHQPPAFESEWADHEVEQDGADRGLSFGLE